MAVRDDRRTGGERIPFYRNVKLLGWIAQIAFLVAVVVAIAFLINNVRMALDRAGFTFGFGFLDDRAGVVMGESPIRYNPSDTYLRVLVAGLLNTVKVALVGVVLCSVLGVTVALMRLSKNWLLRALATGYVELLRNTPLAVQLVFWYYAVILGVPPLFNNPIQLGTVYLSSIGIAFPWVFAGPGFIRWLPALIMAGVVLAAGVVLRTVQLRRADRLGNRWGLPLLAALVVASAGYLLALPGAAPPENLVVDLNTDAGRGQVKRDLDEDGTADRDEPVATRVALRLTVPEGQLTTRSQNLVEAGRVVASTFRFERIDPDEAEEVTVRFADPEDAEARGLELHFTYFPSVGFVYRDIDGDGGFDRGEERPIVDGEVVTFNGVRLVQEVRGFERRLVSDRDGTIYFPPFKALGSGRPAAANGGGGGGGGLGALFGAPAGDAGEEDGLGAEIEFLPSTPLVYSEPTVPRSEYVGGAEFSSAFLALLLALAIYTSSFVAEIVRGGIQAVPNGQREAANALGLSSGQTFSLVVFPQAVRIILPPMISQYLNLAKNSSLAILVSFEDFFNMANVVGNQTGQFVPVFVIILLGYLGLSLVFSFVLNIVNERTALVER